ncbi:MAG TPA: hypothetical protein VIJ68_01420, partial [Candidatus Saccharimonadales bacterium]
MNLFANFLGRLTPQAFQHSAITNGGVAAMVLGALLVVGLLTYFKRWKWLYREWLTTVDPKK